MKILVFLVSITIITSGILEEAVGFDVRYLRSLIVDLLKLHVPEKMEKTRLYMNKKPGQTTVGTTTGYVAGFISKSERDGVEYAAYLGIPYAEPPVGELRFKAPVPVKAWTFVRDAIRERPGCVGVIGLYMDEDCLFVNVYSPRVPSKPKAVMVFLYGGAFMAGSSNSLFYSPDFFVDKDIVFVTLNYRVGPFGFLSLQNEEVPGNAGLKDQILALKWIKQNIANFGGDPNRIVIFGESAGSASVSYLQLSPQARGLFNGIIMQSGNALSHWAYLEPEIAVQHAFSLGKSVNCSYDISKSESKEKLVKCLRDVSSTKLRFYSVVQLGLEDLQTLRLFAFVPTTEPDFTGAVITKRPGDILQSDNFYKVNVMLGQNSNEALILRPTIDILDRASIFIRLLMRDMSHFVPLEIRGKVTEKQVHRVGEEIRRHYLKNSLITPFRIPQVLDIISDLYFTLSTQELALLLAKKSNFSVYNYMFSYRGSFNLLEKFLHLSSSRGASHGDELGYMMNNIMFRSTYLHEGRNTTDQKMIDSIVGMWTNFAKYGNPTPSFDPLIGVIWRPFTSKTYYYLDIGPRLVLKQAVLSDRMHFWNNLFDETVHRRPFPELTTQTSSKQRMSSDHVFRVSKYLKTAPVSRQVYKRACARHRTHSKKCFRN